MKLCLDLVLCGVLLVAAGSELVAPDALSAEQPDAPCQTDEASEGATWPEAKERILAEGYSEVRALTRDCGNVWHALAFAEGDPVRVQVTPAGMVLVE